MTRVSSVALVKFYCSLADWSGRALKWLSASSVIYKTTSLENRKKGEGEKRKAAFRLLLGFIFIFSSDHIFFPSPFPLLRFQFDCLYACSTSVLPSLICRKLAF